MYTIDKLFCTDLVTGTIAYGWVSICFFVLTFVTSIFNHTIGDVFYGSIILCAVTALLIYAANKRSFALLLPWLVVMAFILIIGVPVEVFFTFWNFLTKPGELISRLLMLIIFAAIKVYVWIGVYSLYEMLKSEKSGGGIRNVV